MSEHVEINPALVVILEGEVLGLALFLVLTLTLTLSFPRQNGIAAAQGREVLCVCESRSQEIPV